MKRKSNSSTGTLKDDLEYAKLCLIEGSYTKARNTLVEIIVNREYNQNSPMIFYLSGIACFGSNDIIASRTHFQTALEKDSNHVLSYLYLSVIAILTDERAEAVNCLLRAKEECNKHINTKYQKYVHRAFEYLKDYSSDDDRLLDIFSNPYERKIIPRYGQYIQQKKIVKNIIWIVCLLALIGIGGRYTYSYVMTYMIAPNNERLQIIAQLNENLNKEDYIQNADDAILTTLTTKQYNKLVSTIEKDFVRYRENKVWVNANIILNSNVSQEQKNRVLLITRNLQSVDYTSNVTWFDYSTVSESAWKYNNVVVKWKGTLVKNTLSNNTTNPINAQFLVNFYEMSKELLGTIDVIVPPDIYLNSGDEVELLAIVRVEPDLSQSNIFVLEVVSFRYIAPQ